MPQGGCRGPLSLGPCNQGVDVRFCARGWIFRFHGCPFQEEVERMRGCGYDAPTSAKARKEQETYNR